MFMSESVILMSDNHTSVFEYPVWMSLDRSQKLYFNVRISNPKVQS